MCKPVIFDDGGSLRIREMEDDKFMDGLISPPSKAVPSNQNFFDKGTNKFVCTLTVRYLDEDGVFATVPLVSSLYGLVLAANDTVTITSESGKVATITFPNNVLSILLGESATGSHEGSRRRYIIPKFGKIVSVAASVSGPVTIDANVKRAYTAVHFSPGPPTATVADLERHKEHDERHRHR